jgi:hypothetical protein
MVARSRTFSCADAGGAAQITAKPATTTAHCVIRCIMTSRLLETFPLQHPLIAIIPDKVSGDRLSDRTALQQSSAHSILIFASLITLRQRSSSPRT